MGIFGGNTSGADSAKTTGMLRAIGAGQAMQLLAPQYKLARETMYGEKPFQPYQEAGTGALGTMQGALGLGTPEQRAQAVGAFQTSPGYQFALDQGLQAVDRNASSRGLLGSGNTLMALNDYAQGRANQEYGDWLSRVGGLTQLGMQGAHGGYGQQRDTGLLDYGYGKANADILMDSIKGQANDYAEGRRSDAASNAQGQANLFSLGTNLLGMGGNLFKSYKSGWQF